VDSFPKNSSKQSKRLPSFGERRSITDSEYILREESERTLEELKVRKAPILDGTS